MQDSIYKPRSNAQEFKIGGWVLCVRTNSIYKNGDKNHQVELEHRLVLLLLFFIDNLHEILSRDAILATIWKGKVVNYDSLAVAISHLRKALGDDPRAPQYIKTIPGVGYQFIAKADSLTTVYDHSSVSPSGYFLSRRKIIILAGVFAAIISFFSLYFLIKLLIVETDRKIPVDKFSPEMKELSTNIKTHLLENDQKKLLAAIRDARRILEKYPSYAEGYVAIAEAKIQLFGEELTRENNCAEILSLLDKAISLDSTLVSARIRYADVIFWCKHDYATAEKNYRKAMELDLQNDHAPMQYAQLLLTSGKFTESLQQVDRARQLNPLNYPVPVVVWIYQMQGRNDLAMRELTRIQRAEPDNRYFHISAYRVNARANNSEQAFLHWRWLMQAAGYSETDLQEIDEEFSRYKLPGVYRWLLTNQKREDLGEYTPPLSFARYALATGDTERAMDYLQQAFVARQLPLLWAAVDPAYDSIRRDLRFQSLLQNFLRPVTD